MGKKSPPSIVTSRNETVIDPQLKQGVMDNVGMAKVLTSGMLPQFKAPAQSDGQAAAPAFYNGLNGDYGFGGLEMPYATQVGGGFNADPSSYVNANGTPFVPPSTFTAGFSPDQLAAQGQIRNIAGQSFTPNDFGADVADRLKNFNPLAMTPAAMQAASMQGATIGQTPEVVAARMRDLNFGDFTNPYKNEVLDPLKAYANEMGDRAIASTLGASRMGSGVRGSNEALKLALTAGENTLASGRLMSDAYNRMYETGMGAAQNELSRLTQASGMNASNALQRNISQAGLTQQASAANAQLAQQAAMTNAGYAQQAGLVNNQNQFQQAQMQLQGAQAGGQAQLQARDVNINNAGLLDTVGAQQRGLDQARIEDPFKALQLVSGQVTGALPAFSGSTTTGPSPYGSSGGLAGGIGGAIAGGGLAYGLGSMGALGPAVAAGTAANPALWPLILAGGAAGLLG